LSEGTGLVSSIRYEPSVLAVVRNGSHVAVVVVRPSVVVAVLIASVARLNAVRYGRLSHRRKWWLDRWRKGRRRRG